MQKLSVMCLLLLAGMAGMTQAKKTSAQKPTTKQTSKTPGTSKAVLKNAVDSMSYAIGVLDANFFKQQGLQKVNSDLIKLAYEDVVNGKKPLLTIETCDMTVREQLQAYAKEKSKAVVEEGRKFLEANKTKNGVKTTASGIQYEVLTMGSGPLPAANSVVKVHYDGWLLDGTKFDSSRDRGEPADIPLERVIAGWKEGIQMMPVGSRFKFYIPSDLGYGDRGSPPTIPGGATLVFDVELISIVK